MKVAKACKECRSGKRKCQLAETGRACHECKRRAISCSLVRAMSKQTAPQHILPQFSRESPGLSRATRTYLAKIYIELIHDKPHTIFHPPTLVRQAEAGTLSNKVMLAVAATAARFSEVAAISSKTSEFVSAATEALKRDIDDVSLEGIQASILIGNICGAENRPQAESLFFGVALRMAQILHLPRNEPDDDHIKREVRLRIWWSLYMLDRWSSAGNDVPRQIHDTCDVPLPMDEVEFVFLTPETAPPSPTRPGLYGRMVQLADVFCQVQDLHRQHVDHNISNLEAEERTYHLASALDQFANTLPPDLQMSETNLHSNAERGLGSAFVALHLGYHHYSTLLYFQYLDLQLDQNATVVDFAAKCRHHAAAFSDLLGLSMKAPGCGVVYLIVAHMTAVSSATLLHTLFFGRQEELDETRERLKANFETLVRLKRFWPAVAHMTERLFEFQNACMWSVDANTHKVDRWMVRFLLQHALPVPEKERPGERGPSIRDEYADDAMAILRETS